MEQENGNGASIDHKPDLAIVMLYSELRKKKCIQMQSNTAQHLIPQSKSMLMGILERCSNYFKAVNSLSLIIGWKKRDSDMTELQRMATTAFFKECQNEAATYVDNFRGNGFYTVIEEEIIVVKGRETVDGSTIFKLVPPKTLLYSRMAETFQRKFCDFGSPVYIGTQVLESGYYMPGIVKKLKSLQDKCPSCRKFVQKKLHSAIGAVGRNRLTYSAPFSGMQADLVGPISIKEYVNQRGTRKIWLLTGVCHFSRYISLTVVESRSKESILNALKLHPLTSHQSLVLLKRL